MDAPDPGAEGRPPLGAWHRIYALVVACTLVIWWLLWLLTSGFNLPLPARSG